MKYFRFLFSGTLMGILLVVFAIAIGYATIIENDFDAITAKMLIYNAKWFEMIMVLMIINFTGMIFTRQLYRKSKLNILVIHISLIIIIVGAAITRYIGFEGQMHIREGDTTDKYLSLDSYFNAHIEKAGKSKSVSKRIWLTPVNKRIFDEKIVLENTEIQVSTERYMPNAVQALVENQGGTPVINLLSAGPQGRDDLFLAYGQSAMIQGIGVVFGDTTDTSKIRFALKDSQLLIAPAIQLVTGSDDSAVSRSEFQPVQVSQILNYPGINLMIKDFKQKASVAYVPAGENETGEKIMMVNIQGADRAEKLFLKYGTWGQATIDGSMVSVKFGNQTWQLPFALRLNEFQLERYPGSMSPSSFASEVTVFDKEMGVEMPYRIFMNNILDYRGYRFYQSSYDKDEKGTILSVNHDYLGTVVTYIGYFLLFGSLIVSFFTKKTRFSRISQQLKEIHDKRKKLVSSVSLILILLISTISLAQKSPAASKEHAASFGKMLVQNKDGRVIPINTVSSQVLVKIYKKNKFEGLTSDQVFLGMILDRGYWQERPMIKVSDDALKSMLGIRGNYASFIDFFDEKGQYKLKRQVDESYAKKPALRNMFDKEIIYVDERVNVAFMAFTGPLLKIIPNKDNAFGHWESPLDMHDHGRTESGNRGMDLFNNYINQLREAVVSNNYKAADAALEQFKAFQVEMGGELIPPATQTNMEVLYNNLNIFKALFPIFMTVGVVLFAFLFVQIFNPSLKFTIILRVLAGILFLGFLAQTAGLIMRWYIAGHAPWSNGYESMIYIAWATMLAGFMFMKRSPIILSVTALLAGVTLLTAHMSWLNPEITNLVPVLKSYWLTIHVATITASYGFFGLACLTGLLNLSIMIFRNKDNHLRINLTLRELTLIIELSLTIGLILMIMGNFLGGIWANESWGRYWGWDPKETWSLVTIIVYSFILHMRLIPGMRSTFTFNFLSMFGFASVLMTYFGVNYYLSGLHSYAAGDPIPVPTFVYYTLGIMIVISILAGYNDFRIKDQTPVMEELEEE